MTWRKQEDTCSSQRGQELPSSQGQVPVGKADPVEPELQSFERQARNLGYKNKYSAVWGPSKTQLQAKY